MKIDQDEKQRIKSLLLFFLESFKVFMATLLVVFVPQRCDNTTDGSCSLQDNFANLDNYNLFCLIFNFITLFNFLTLYVVEKKREFWCIEFLDVNDDKPNTNLHSEIETYPNIKEKLLKLNRLYQLITKVLLNVVVINTITSAVLIYHYYYLDYRSITVFLSNLLLVADKMYNSYHISNKSIRDLMAYSAYMKTPIVYNTIDSDHIIRQNDVEMKTMDKKEGNEGVENEIKKEVCEKEIELETD
jgi:hypothetical protein